MKANTIEEFFGTLLQSVTEAHKKHLMTGKYSDHKALNEFYDEMPDLVDALVEHWQGTHGKVKDLKNDLLSDNMDTVKYMEELLDMCKDAKESLLDDDEALCSDVDDIIGQISSTLYQLNELQENMKDLSTYLKESLNEAKQNYTLQYMYLDEYNLQDSGDLYDYASYMYVGEEEEIQANSWNAAVKQAEKILKKKYSYPDLVAICVTDGDDVETVLGDDLESDLGL